MKISRRMTFQLTPLLDLMLIVIFAQYLEVKETSARNQLEVQQQLAELEQLRTNRGDRLEQLESQLSETVSDLAKTRLMLSEAEEIHQAELKEWDRKFQQALDQQMELANLTKKIFEVPEELINQAIDPELKKNPEQYERELQKLQTRFQELAEQQAELVIKHVKAHEELRKLADIWEVQISNIGEASLFTDIRGPNRKAYTFSFFNRTAFEQDLKQAIQSKRPEPLKTVMARYSEQFSEKLVSIYKTLPQPKSLVIVMYSYDDQSLAAIQQISLDGFQSAVKQMQLDSGGQTRFRPVILGILNDETASSP